MISCKITDSKNDFHQITSEPATPQEKILGNKVLLLKILENLSTKELSSAQLVCKTWRKLIIDKADVLFELDSFPALEKYKFIYKNVEDFNEADFYLVGQNHTFKTCQKWRGNLINRLGIHHRVIVLVEGSPSMKNITDNFDFFMQEFCIHPSLKEKISFIGWDAENLNEEMGNCPRLHCWLLEEDIDCMNMIEELTQKINKLCPELSNEKLFQLNIEDLKTVLDLTEKLKKIENWQKKVQRELERGCATEEKAKQTFPQRTLNMINTLSEIQYLIDSGQFVGKVVLACGAEHVRTATKNIDIEEYKLDKLYQFLIQLKALVMISKEIDTDSNDLR